MKTLSVILTFVAILYANTLFAQATLASARETDNTISADERIDPPAAYYRAFQAIVFPRNNGNVAIHIAKTAGEQVTINVYNKQQQLISTQHLSKHTLFKMQYVTKGLAKGNYTFEIASRDKIYRKNLDID